jgi:hypothetical protein
MCRLPKRRRPIVEPERKREPGGPCARGRNRRGRLRDRRHADRGNGARIEQNVDRRTVDRDAAAREQQKAIGDRKTGTKRNLQDDDRELVGKRAQLLDERIA